MGESISSAALGNAEIAALICALADTDPGADDAVRIDRIRLLEELKAATAAAQAVETAAFVDSQRRAQRCRDGGGAVAASQWRDIDGRIAERSGRAR